MKKILSIIEDVAEVLIPIVFICICVSAFFFSCKETNKENKIKNQNYEVDKIHCINTCIEKKIEILKNKEHQFLGGAHTSNLNWSNNDTFEDFKKICKLKSLNSRCLYYPNYYKPYYESKPNKMEVNK